MVVSSSFLFQPCTCLRDACITSPIPALEQACCIGILSAFLEQIGVALPSPDLQAADGMSFLESEQRSADILTIWEGGKYTLVVRLQLLIAFPTLSNLSRHVIKPCISISTPALARQMQLTLWGRHPCKKISEPCNLEAARKKNGGGPLGYISRRYSNYLIQRAKSFGDTHVDHIRNPGRLKTLSISKGLLRETEAIQDQIRVLIKCDVGILFCTLRILI